MRSQMFDWVIIIKIIITHILGGEISHGYVFVLFYSSIDLNVAHSPPLNVIYLQMEIKNDMYNFWFFFLLLILLLL